MRLHAATPGPNASVRSAMAATDSWIAHGRSARRASSSTAAKGAELPRPAAIRPAPAPTETSSGGARGGARTSTGFPPQLRVGRRERGRRNGVVAGRPGRDHDRERLRRLVARAVFVQAPARQRRPRRCVNKADFDLRARPAGGETSSTSRRASAGIVASAGARAASSAATSAGVGQVAVPRTSIAVGATGAAVAATSATAMGETRFAPPPRRQH